MIEGWLKKLLTREDCNDKKAQVVVVRKSQQQITILANYI